jgi:hypothetical protein
MHDRLIAIVLVLGAASAARAEPLTGAAATTMLFAPGEAQVQIVSGSPLSEDDAKLLAMVVADQPYFGAIAISPDEKLLESKATIAVANYHSTEAASAEALRQCEGLRQGQSPCMIAAVIRPKGWEQRGLSLSSEATAGFGASYPQTAGALAISGTSGAWGIASGQGAAEAAVTACAQKASVKDCTVVIAE